MSDDVVHSRDVSVGATLARLQRKGKITPAQVAALRASELGLGVRSIAEAEALLVLERNGAEKCRQWGEFFVQTMLDFLVWDERPAGRLAEERACWLSDQVGERPTPACLALLVAILDEAHEVPAWFPQSVRLRASKVFAQASDDPRHLAA